MKKVRSFIKHTIQTLIVVYIVGIILLQIPAVQGFIANNLAKVISKKIGSEVKIERVDIGFLNRAVIDNLMIYDQNNRQMISATRVAAKVELIPLLKNGKISISSAQLFGLKANLYKANKDAKNNFQFALDSLASKDKNKKSKLDLAIHSLIIRNGFVKYDQLDIPKVAGLFSPKHLGLSNLSGHIILNHATDSQLNLQIHSLSFVERSGFQLDDLYLRADLDETHLKVSKLTVKTPNSKISNASLEASYSIHNGRLDRETLKAHSDIKNAIIYSPDFKAFIPKLAKLNKQLTITERTNFENNNIKIQKLFVSSKDKTILANLNGYINIRQKTPHISLTAKPIKITEEALTLIDNIFNLKIPSQVKNLGNIYYNGRIETLANSIIAKGTLKSDAGNAKLNFKVIDKNIYLDLNTPSLNIGKIAGDPKFGYITANVKLNGTTDLKQMDMNANVPHFDYNGYSYKNLNIKGLYAQDSFSGIVSLDDPNGNFLFKGIVRNIRQFIEKKEKIAFDSDIMARGFNLSALKLTNILGNKTISFNATLKGAASSVNDMNGVLSLSNTSLIGDGKILSLNYFILKSKSSLFNKTLDVNSDLGTIQLNGLYDYLTIVQSFKNVIHHYLPSLSTSGFGHVTLSKKNNFAFNIKAEDVSILKDYVNIPLLLKSPLYINGHLNENAQALDMNLSSKDLVYSGNEMKNLEITIAPDRTKLGTTINGEYNNTKNQRIQINSIADISNNHINSNINFFIPGHTPLRGRINSFITLINNGNGITTKVHFDHSNIKVDTIDLQVQPSDLEYRQKKLTIDHFEVSNKTQHIIVNGSTSGNNEDSLMVHLKDIDVPYILDLVNFKSVEFGGLASGTASVKSVFSKPIVNANLNVKGFTFENGAMGDLTTHVHFNSHDGIVYINGRTIAGDNSYTDIKGHVDVKNEYINLPIYPHNTKLYFLEGFCSSFMDKIEGSTTGWVKVVGPLSKINLEGDLTAQGNMYIKPTGVTYFMKNAHIQFIPNEIIFDNDTIYDKNGNIGIVTGGLHHVDLKRLSYNINIVAHNLLSYNFPRQINKESFWGIVYGTGACRIMGQSGETTLNVSLAPNRGTHIIYDAAEASTLNETSFIRWTNSALDSIKVPKTEQDFIHRTTITPQSKDIVFRDFDIPSDVRMNFDFRVNPNLTLEVILDERTHDNILLNGSGGIRATYYNKGAFQMFGNFVVDHGLYNLTIQNVIKKQFSFNQGSTISFGGDPFNAALNLQGVYSLNSVPLSDLQLGQSFASNNTKVNCLLDIKGTPAAPNITFGLDLPNLSSDAQQMVHSLLNSEQDLNQQALYLLAVGRFYPQGNNNARQESAVQSSTSLAMQSFLSGTLSQQINTVLSNVIKTNNWNFGANIATGNEGFDNAEYEGLFSGSLLNNRLLFNGEVGYRDNVATNNSSFIGDFDLRYLVKRNGNIALHFYNKTNDRYFTRNSLNTQGIGLILKKDFNTLGDIFHRTKRKSTTKGKKMK